MYEEYYFKRWGHGGESIVYLHHFGGAGLNWQWVVQSLGDAYTHFAIDIPGFGSSTAVDEPSLETMADSLEGMIAKMPLARTACLVAHSFGAKLAMEMLARHGDERWRQIVFVTPSAPSIDPMSNKEMQRLLVHPHRESAEDNVRRSVHLPLNPDRFQLAVETQLMADPVTWRWWLNEGIHQPTSLEAGMLRCPVTVLASQRDPVIPLSFSQREILKVIPHASFVSHPRGGHLLPLEDTAWVARQLQLRFRSSEAADSNEAYSAL